MPVAKLSFEQKLKNYASLIVRHGLNVQTGQLVNLIGEVSQRDLLCQVAEAAYQVGARFVAIEMIDPRLAKIRLDHSKTEDLSYLPKFVGLRMNELVDQKAANLKLCGSEYPDILSEADPKKVNAIRLTQYQAVKRFYDDGVGKSQVHWNVAAAATPAWGKKVFPKESPENACRLLWEEIFRLCRVDREDYLQVWKTHNSTLQRRAKKLTELKIKKLRFLGPNTDLIVGLSPKAIFKGGGEQGPRGVEFEPNLPTEECFTTPDWRMTEGQVTTTRPFLINGKMIRGLRVEFKAGEIINFDAEEGSETFREYISSDEGGKRLGEVALVGTDSPVYQSGLVYEEILFDENAACHIAIGSAYKFCLQGGSNMSPRELIELGCNESSVHTDMMISSDKVDVKAECYNGSIVDLLIGGKWCDL